MQDAITSFKTFGVEKTLIEFGKGAAIQSNGAPY